MVREIILVELIIGYDISTDKSKAFADVKKAEDYFTELLKEWFPDIEQDEIDNALDDGFYDFTIHHPNGEEDRRSISIKDISLVEEA